MALIDHFSTGGGQAPAEANGNWAVAVDAEFASGYSLGPQSFGASADVLDLGNVASTSNAAIVHFRVDFNNPTSAANLLFLKQSDVSNYLVFRHAGSGNFDWGFVTQLAGSPTGGGSFSQSVEINAKSVWEIKWLPHPTTGVLVVRVDGVTVVNVSSGDTEGTPGGGTGYQLLAGWNLSQRQTLGDIVFWDDSGAAPFNDFVGAMSIPFLPVDGSAESDWVGDDADSVDNHLRVDAVPMGSDGYVESATSTDRQVFDTDDSAVASGATIYSVKAVAYGEEPAAGSQDLNIGVREGATDSAVKTVTVGGTAAKYSSGPVETQPDGGGAWDSTALAATQVVLEVA